MTQKILIDSSGLVGFIDRRSKAFNEIASVIDTSTNIVIIPASTIPEASYVISSRLGHGAMRLFARELITTAPTIENLTPVDYLRIAEVLNTYADLRLDFVDASIVAMAERLNIRHILTLDRRDFSVVRPKHCPYFELLP